ncbi:uncharacterized protein F5891DRAFT_1248415 [Suillus fuscotomentosus]|uniref:Uncharacterized protein n=1 Tax=Suillus fuscotomentosus TaxID=1912939 RepID=A0AAD4HH66_9AGAM|nr:uncharacterized protein F5891DRAFT_1248415 [Suillus fuscotomentosus]KAG1896081.1 hypothetical protein F5891DRAFT_1248415 [Suillus fuscotomentosus]
MISGCVEFAVKDIDLLKELHNELSRHENARAKYKAVYQRPDADMYFSIALTTVLPNNKGGQSFAKTHPYGRSNNNAVPYPRFPNQNIMIYFLSTPPDRTPSPRKRIANTISGKSEFSAAIQQTSSHFYHWYQCATERYKNSGIVGGSRTCDLAYRKYKFSG